MKADEAVAEILTSMSRGQYILLAEAVAQLGGELRIEVARLEETAEAPLPRMEVDAGDGPVVLRLVG